MLFPKLWKEIYVKVLILLDDDGKLIIHDSIKYSEGMLYSKVYDAIHVT